MARKATELRPLMLRIPEGLRRRLEKEAARTDRSMNAEITHRLERSFDPPPFDLFGQLQETHEQALSRFGEDHAETRGAVARTLCAGLTQLYPDLLSIVITRPKKDGSGALDITEALSAAGSKLNKGDKS